jgi:glyoxylase-like metal-dependent hydrolase (beta-lactamase superfamily II)
LVVVDTQFPATTVEFLKGLPGREGRAIDVVINSHHHPDHTGGNSVFRPVTKTIVAQKLVPQLQFDQSSKERGTGGYQIYADTTFDTDWSFDAGDEKVSVKFLGGPAHTASDSIIFFEKANVVHVADFVFNRQYPMTDRPGGCNIQSWITTLETIASTYPKDAIYVFGHAKKGYAVTGTPADLLGQRDYLTGLLDYVGGQIKAGTANLTGQEIPGFPDWKAPLPNFLGRNLAAAWQELKGEPRPQYGKT